MILNPSRLSSEHSVLVIDASVVINLLGTGKPADLLGMLNRRVNIDELALNEVTSDPLNKLPGRDAVEALLRSGLISSGRLSALAFEVFLELTGATPPDDLGDGEAATIAQSFDIGAVPVIDERKATRIALSMRPTHPIHYIPSIFWHVQQSPPRCRSKNSAISFIPRSSMLECEFQ